jgi:hypothetical protein
MAARCACAAVGDAGDRVHERSLPRRQWANDEIVRAIEAVEQAGLTVRSVEITQSGSIKIETGPRQQQSSRAVTTHDADVEPEAAKKQA